MNSYEERKLARIERLNAAADRAEEKSKASYATATEMASAIPFGQPILVGHRSERSDRSYRKRIDSAYQKSFDEQGKADYLRKKAEAAERNTAISSDDPDAIEKLQAKLEELQKLQEVMKGVNRYYRKHGTCVGCDLITEETAKRLDDDIKNRFSGGRDPFPSFKLSNNNQAIRNVKKRIESLQNRDETDYEDVEFEGGKVVYNKEINRIQFFFDEKPTQEIRTTLKSWGFHYSRYNNNAWQRQINSSGVYAMKSVLKFLEKPLVE